jgi:restriction system protein
VTVAEETKAPEPPNLIDIFRDALPELRETVPEMLVPLWPLWLVFGAILLARGLHFIYRQRRLARSGIREIDAMDGPTFERYLATTFRRLGYSVEVVGSSRGDYGGDLVIRKNRTRTVVQAKRYARKKVGIKAVQEAHTAKAMYDCARAMVVTNSVFSEQAKKTARKTGVELWSRDELVGSLVQARRTAQPPAERAPKVVALHAASEPGEAPAPPPAEADEGEAICARCGVGVSEKVREYCRANAERFGGLVYCYRHQRGFRRRAS